MCCTTPGKQCLASPLANYVLHQPWETMCCQLWSSAFGSPALVPSFGPLLWAPVLGRQGPWPIGPVCVASPLEHYVLHQSLETMCCIALRKLRVVSPLGNYVLHHCWETMCCISPGKLICCNTPGNNVLRHPWETMCWVGPVKLCVVSLVLSFWVPSFGSQLWSAVLGPSFGPTGPIGPVCVAAPLVHYVLHQSLETMCCIALRKLCVVSPLGNYVLHHPWETMCCIIPGKVCVAPPLGNNVLHHPWETMCGISPGKLCVASLGVKSRCFAGCCRSRAPVAMTIGV